MTTNELYGKSNVNVVPRGNNVLVRMKFHTTLLALTSGKYDKDSAEEVEFSVAGFGPMVHDLELGGKILMEITQAYNSIEVEGNERSIKALLAHYNALPKKELNEIMHDPKVNRIEVIQYGMFPEFQIKARVV